jgi:glycosyltransferase involved in cell wall biosynthesis
MFSLCIATMDRYDDFLETYLPLYLANPLIDEIIITDENGDDAMKIWSNFEDPRLKVFVNEGRLGPLKNKMKALRLASNQWIALIDSDNFADASYFEVAEDFIRRSNPSNTSIIAPAFSRPGNNDPKNSAHEGFNFMAFQGGNLSLPFLRSKSQHYLRTGQDNITILLNQGNYIINKHLVDTVSFAAEDPDLIDNSSSFDVIYFNTLLYEQFSAALNFYVVPGLEYRHSVHDNSIYLTTRDICKKYSCKLFERFYALCAISG